eukprot:2612863-Pleurochrysis_carterae.AAC.1
MALVAAIATFHPFFRHFPRVVLESDSLSATFHLADDKAKDDAAQRAHLSTCTPCLLFSPQSRRFMCVMSLAQPT